MLLDDMIDLLECIKREAIAEGVDENPPVRIASQPSYPMEYKVNNVEFVQPSDKGKPKTVYIVEAYGNEYLASGVAEEIGW